MLEKYTKEMISCLTFNLYQNIIMTTLHKDVSAFRANVKCNPLIFVKICIELNKIHPLYKTHFFLKPHV